LYSKNKKTKKPKSHEKATGCSKHECSKGKSNGYMPKTNEWETKRWKNQDDRTTLREGTTRIDGMTH
jgi:hypothetical protein